MCTELYLASDRPLRVVGWNDDGPGFHLWEIPDEGHFIKRFLGIRHLYQVGSFMGCACGFYYGEWSKATPSENHEARVKDVYALLDYLGAEAEQGPLRLFAWEYGFDSWNWDWKDASELPSVPIQFDPQMTLGDEFAFEDNCIYDIQVRPQSPSYRI